MSLTPQQCNDSSHYVPTATQQLAARVVGALYILTMATSIISEMGFKAKVMVIGDAAQTSARLRASGDLMRMAFGLDLVTYIGVAALAWGFT